MKTSTSTLERYTLNGQTMGTRYSTIFFASRYLDKDAISAALFAAVDQVDRQMSTWKPDSDLNLLNAAAVNQWHEVPAELLYVLNAAVSIGVQSRGAFDIGVGDLVSAWGFGAEALKPNEQQIQNFEKREQRTASDILEIDLAQQRVRKKEVIKLDLSGIAKGHGVDTLALCLDSFGINNYLVGIDGEMRAKGTKPDGQAWAVAIEKPVRHVREVIGVMELVDASIATSGDYRHWIEMGGNHYAHTIDPESGRPVANSLASVTVVMSTCMLADAWATALMVMGLSAAKELAQRQGMTVMLISRVGDTFEEVSILEGQIQ